MRIATPRTADWHLYGREADSTEVVVSKSRLSGNGRIVVSSVSASYDATTNGQLDMYGLSKVGTMDLTDTDVLNLTTDKFTVTGHGLADNEQVVFHTNGGTAPTGLTSGTTYFVILTDANNFQLETSIGSGAINMSGTQSGFATEAVILPLSKSWQIYDSFNMDWSSPLRCTENAPLILKLEAVSGKQGILNASGFTD